MLTDLLFDGRADEYLRQAAPGDNLSVFVHVPKTAGTSLRTEIAAFLRPDINIVVDYTETSRSFHERMDEAVEEFLVNAARRRARFGSGHILARHVARIRTLHRDACFFTFLRDPLDRVVSDYRYQRSTRHPVHREFIARVPSLDAYCDLGAEQNKMAQHLVAADILARGDVSACIDFVRRTYAFVGIQEEYRLSFRILTTLLGQPLWPKVRANVNAEAEEERQVSPATAARIRAANRLDVALYDHFAERFAEARPALAGRFAEG